MLLPGRCVPQSPNAELRPFHIRDKDDNVEENGGCQQVGHVGLEQSERNELPSWDPTQIQERSKEFRIFIHLLDGNEEVAKTIKVNEDSHFSDR